jgi:hypothetical protein
VLIGMFVSNARKLCIIGGSIIICTFHQISQYSDLLWLDGPGFKSCLGGDFSAQVQTDPGAHPASCTVGTGSFPGVKRPGRGIDHPPRFIAEVKERVELYLYSPSGPLRPVLGRTLPLPLSFYSSPNLIMIMKPLG